MAAALPSEPAWLVTTGRDPSGSQEAKARELARELGAPFVPRRGRALRCPEAVQRCAFLVVERDGLAIHAGGSRLTYHPGMSLHRIRRLRSGGSDPMVEAMGLSGGERVLDATLGLASDALVASFAVGPAGRVTGVEKVKPLAVLVRQGLRSYPWRDGDLAAAAARIEVVAADHRAFLASAGPGSFDVVYFDVMFDRPLSGSISMASWRSVADESPLAPEALRAALSVARRRVVVKDRRDSPRLSALGPARLWGGRSSRVVYGVWDV